MGIFLYELFHNKDCFDGNDHYQILSKIKKMDLDFSENCPEQAKDLIQKILQFEPEKRLSLEDALYHPFMKDYTISRNGIPEELRKKSESSRLKLLKENAEIVTDLINNTKTPELGYIDTNLNYKKGVRPKKLKEEQKRDTKKRLLKFDQKYESAQKPKPVPVVNHRSNSICTKKVPYRMPNKDDQSVGFTYLERDIGEKISTRTGQQNSKKTIVQEKNDYDTKENYFTFTQQENYNSNTSIEIYDTKN